MRADQIIKKPVITEKSLAQATRGVYSFEVAKSSSKGEIAQAIEGIFGVHVFSVKTLVSAGKKKKVGPRRRVVTGAAKKKAIVKLAKGEKLEIFTVPGQEEPKKKS